MRLLLEIAIALGALTVQVPQVAHQDIADRIVPTDFTGAVLQDKNLFVSMYDPSLGGINCSEPCERTRSGKLVKNWYNLAAACPYEMMGDIILVPYVGTFQCIDTGGLVTEEDDHIKIDFLIWRSEFGELGYDFSAQIERWYIIENKR